MYNTVKAHVQRVEHAYSNCAQLRNHSVSFPEHNRIKKACVITIIISFEIEMCYKVS